MRFLDVATWLSDATPVLVDAAVRGAIVLLIALGVTHLLRRRSAAARHLVWVCAVMIQLALPVFVFWGPRWNLAVAPDVANVMPLPLPQVPAPSGSGSSPAASAAASGKAARAVDVESPSGVITSGVSAAEKSAGAEEASSSRAVDGTVTRRSMTRTDVLIALWAFGATLVLVRLAVGTVVVARLARSGDRVDDGAWLSLAQRIGKSLHIERPLTLLRGHTLGVPVTWGIVYPVVLLPEDADNWTEERRRFVLVHEMAHVKRFDALTQLAGQIALALFWFNPLVWVANRRMQLEREHACDDYVIRHGTTPSLYAEELLGMVRAIGTPNHRTAQPAFAALAMARRSEFEGRMLSILDPVLDRHPLRRGRAWLSAACAMLFVVPLAALHPYEQMASAPVPHAATRSSTGGTHYTVPERASVYVAPVDSSVTSIQQTVNAPAAPVEQGPKLESLVQRLDTLATLNQRLSSARLDFTVPKRGCANPPAAPKAGGTSTHIHQEDDADGSMVLSYLSYNAMRCASATINGTPKFSAGEEDVSDMRAGSRATFYERSAAGDRALAIVGTRNGMERVYTRDGQPESYGDDARRWMSAFLPRVLMESGYNVGPRVAHWRAEGGVDSVLARIARIPSTGAKRAHYEALLTGTRLTPAELDKVVRSAGEQLRSSSGDLRAVLTRVPHSGPLGKTGNSAIDSALGSMASSGDKSAVLQVYGQTDDRDMLLGVMRVSTTIASSGDRAHLLQVLVARYLGKGDRALEDAYFGALEGIPSSGDQRSTLMIALPYASKSQDIAKRIIKGARAMPSSGDQASVLIALVTAEVVTTRQLREAFFSAAAAVPSEGDRVRVLQVAAALRP